MTSVGGTRKSTLNHTQRRSCTGCAGALALNQDLRFNQHAVGNNDGIPITRLNGDVAPGDLFHLSRGLIDFHPIAHGEAFINLQNQSAQNIGEAVLQGENDDPGHDGGGGDDAGEGYAEAREQPESCSRYNLRPP